MDAVGRQGKASSQGEAAAPLAARTRGFLVKQPVGGHVFSNPRR